MNRNLDFIFTKFRLALLENREYKANLYAVLLFDFTAILMMTCLYLLIENVSNISKWSTFDFFTLVLFAMLCGKIIYGFIFSNFNLNLIQGDLNNWIAKPTSPFSYMLMINVNGANTLTLLILIFPICLIISLFQEQILLGWIIFTLGCVLNLILMWFVELTSFFIKENSFIRTPVTEINYLFEEYLPLFFKNTSFFKFLGIIPSVIFSFLTVSVMKGDFQYFYLIYPTLIAIPILGFLCIILYKKGLKKYEAFG